MRRMNTSAKRIPAAQGDTPDSGSGQGCAELRGLWLSVGRGASLPRCAPSGDSCDPLRTDTAATADDARAGVVPPVKQVRGELDDTGAFDPFVRRTIPDASPVRVHDERQVGRGADIGQQRFDVLWRRAVHADRGHQAGAGDGSHRFADRRAVTEVMAVAAAEGDPRLSAGYLGQELPEDRGLASARDSLDREQIGFGVNHRADTPALLCCDVIVSRAAVIPGVLGAVRPYEDR